MFGTYRFVLALLVALGHFWMRAQPAPIYAVFCFYLLSGYLMCVVLNGTYGFSPRGIGLFLANRALRIYPPYLVMLVVLLLTSAVIPQVPRPLRLVPPGGWTWGNLLENAVIVGLTIRSKLFIPPAWSLNVELVFYVALALLLARGRAIAVAWLAASLLYTVSLVWHGAFLAERYFPVGAAALPFSLGATLYWVRGWLPGASAGRVAVAGGAFLANVIVGRLLWSDLGMEGFYVSLGLGTLLTATLAVADPARCPPWLARFDRRLGDLAYPLFLCHLHAGAVVWWLTRGWRPAKPLLIGLSLGGAVLEAWLLHRAVEVPLQSLRAALRRPSPPGGA